MEYGERLRLRIALGRLSEVDAELGGDKVIADGDREEGRTPRG